MDLIATSINNEHFQNMYDYKYRMMIESGIAKRVEVAIIVASAYFMLIFTILIFRLTSASSGINDDINRLEVI